MANQNVRDKMEGTRRVQAEFKYVQKEIQEGRLPQIHNLRVRNDNVLVWMFDLKDFDEDLKGGRQLNEDLKELKRKHGQDHILMEITFSNSYPRNPFFLRVVSPRCQWYTGHVTSGGSICIEALTLSGTPGSWQPSFCVEAILNAAIANMVDCEYVYVTTPTGPGGLSGPLRIDLGCRYHYNVMAEYTFYDAQNAFNRTARNHKQLGWGQSSIKPSSKHVPKMNSSISQVKKRTPVIKVVPQAPVPQHNRLAPLALLHQVGSVGPSVQPAIIQDCLPSSLAVYHQTGSDNPMSKRRCLDVTCAIDLTEDSTPEQGNDTSIEAPKEVISLLDDDNNCNTNEFECVEEQLAEIERNHRMEQSRVQDEALKREQAMASELSAIKQQLAKLKEKPMAILPPEWTPQPEEVDQMILALPIPMSACCHDTWKKQGQGHVTGYAEEPPREDGPAIYKLLRAEQGFFFKRVTRMFRVQNRTFWTKYCLRKADIAKEAGEGGLRETFLWHGADVTTLQSIVEEGFDIRMSNKNCALGLGTYFSESARLSGDYSNMQMHAYSFPQKKQALKPAPQAPIPGGSHTGRQECYQGGTGSKGVCRRERHATCQGRIGTLRKRCNRCSQAREGLSFSVKKAKRQRRWLLDSCSI